jgi:hypothetical protein
MRIAFLVSFAANLMLAAVSPLIAPGTIAIHFGRGGEPNGWAPAYVNALIMAGVNVLLFLVTVFSPRLIRMTPARWINLPHKEYWLKDENRGRAEALLSWQLLGFGTAMFAFLFVLGVLMLDANLSNPVRLHEGPFWWAFGLLMAYTVYWSIHCMRVFQIPPGA